jgi:hypothetical protein
MIGFRCRVPYNSDITKIRTFLDDTESVNVVAGRSGIAFISIPKGEECYYIAAIHAPDIHRLYISPRWEIGTVKVLPSSYITTFLSGRESNADIKFEIDEDATLLTLSIMTGNSVIRSKSIPLMSVDMVYEYPSITDANIVVVVNEFKKFCSTISKDSSEIRLEVQDDGIRFVLDKGDMFTYGMFDETKPFVVSHVSSLGFSKAAQINIGNTKSAYASVAVRDEYPMLIRLKLGMVEFKIYSNRYLASS